MVSARFSNGDRFVDLSLRTRDKPEQRHKAFGKVRLSAIAFLTFGPHDSAHLPEA